nr:gamma-glutamyl-gamma-aminobutyrate hydrolase family protein [Prosthecochloris sp.]
MRKADISKSSAVVTLGGPQSANDTDRAMRRELENLKAILDKKIPYLGICLGMQTLVKAAGGNVITCPIKETGFLTLMAIAMLSNSPNKA